MTCPVTAGNYNRPGLGVFEHKVGYLPERFRPSSPTSFRLRHSNLRLCEVSDSLPASFSHHTPLQPPWLHHGRGRAVPNRLLSIIVPRARESEAGQTPPGATHEPPGSVGSCLRGVVTPRVRGSDARTALCLLSSTRRWRHTDAPRNEANTTRVTADTFPQYTLPPLTLFRKMCRRCAATRGFRGDSTFRVAMSPG